MDWFKKVYGTRRSTAFYKNIAGKDQNWKEMGFQIELWNLKSINHVGSKGVLTLFFDDFDHNFVFFQIS